MESPINSSFIPADAKMASSAPAAPRRRAGSASDFLVLISIVIFVASVALGAAVFLYQQFLSTSNKNKIDQLQRAQEAFQPALIGLLTRLNDRMEAGAKILESHIAPSKILDLLEQSTLTNVAFSSLDFEAGDKTKITIKMQGVAKSVNSIALQADLFGKSGILTSPIFSDITAQADGVHFNLAAVVNPRAILYAQNAASTPQLQGEGQFPQQQTQTSPPPAQSDSPFQL